MTFDEFVDKLYEAGWRSPGDAQWKNIKELWDELCEKGIIIRKGEEQAQ